MSFVKTKEELQEIQRILSEGRCTIEALSIEFETTFEFLRAVLPPCFDLPETPTAIASVSRWQSELCGEFDCGIISLKCRYKELEGTTMLVLIVSGDMPVTIGREMWGEAKKTGIAQVYLDGHEAYGFCERNGARLIEIEAEFGENLGPSSSEAYDFEIKAVPHSSGYGLQHEPILNCMKNQENLRVKRVGAGTLTLSGTALDPLHTIPVVSVGTAYYTEGESSWTVPRLEVLPDGEAYLPFIYGQKFDDFRLFRKPARFQKTLRPA
ncbi:acetoacetate decarboxylase family protein [Pseudomonas yamanorum]|uniref:Acetoacetate decarboxylase family protein n=1 Tax=Pseudomonas yamanorum TaxID=515393 RepID=A0A7Y8JPT3_9PSED|nr:acetoacetate decarboxylase family protein [Pseudomonas yamanorum]NWE13652.1 acetoacetate decarboxylase family protein [Pseudomonas yamanorum]